MSDNDELVRNAAKKECFPGTEDCPIWDVFGFDSGVKGKDVRRARVEGNTIYPYDSKIAALDVPCLYKDRLDSDGLTCMTCGFVAGTPYNARSHCICPRTHLRCVICQTLSTNIPVFKTHIASQRHLDMAQRFTVATGGVPQFGNQLLLPEPNNGDYDGQYEEEEEPLVSEPDIDMPMDYTEDFDQQLQVPLEVPLAAAALDNYQRQVLLAQYQQQQEQQQQQAYAEEMRRQYLEAAMANQAAQAMQDSLPVPEINMQPATPAPTTLSFPSTANLPPISSSSSLEPPPATNSMDLSEPPKPSNSLFSPEAPSNPYNWVPNLPIDGPPTSTPSASFRDMIMRVESGETMPSATNSR